MKSLENFCNEKPWLKKSTGRKIKVLRTDNGSEYILQELPEERMVIHQLTVEVFLLNAECK